MKLFGGVVTSLSSTLTAQLLLDPSHSTRHSRAWPISRTHAGMPTLVRWALHGSACTMHEPNQYICLLRCVCLLLRSLASSPSSPLT
jgi:hypothetical protein